MAEQTFIKSKKYQFPNEIIENTCLKATVLEKSGHFLLVDLSPYGTGIIRGPQFSQAKEMIKNIEVGNELVIRVLEREN